jgi:hypothetical protein
MASLCRTVYKKGDSGLILCVLDGPGGPRDHFASRIQLENELGLYQKPPSS